MTDVQAFTSRCRRVFVLSCLTCGLVAHAAAAADQFGRVLVGGVPVPGATVTAVQREQQRTTVTDPQGIYHFANLADGVWSIKVEMLGFDAASQDVTVGVDAPAATFELKLRPFGDITRGIAILRPEPPPPARAPIAGRAATTPAAPPAGTGFQRAQVNTSAAAPVLASDPAVAADADRTQSAADGFLINGSVNNGAASPFAQIAAFGNNRRGGRSLYNGGFGVLLGNSAWDASPFSFTGQQTPKPSYGDMQLLGSFAGPLKIPGLLANGPTIFLGYQRTVDHNASTQSALMPTALERAGDFSQTRDAFGRAIQILDPSTGRPFPGNVVPSSRISPQAAALLGEYPLPNLESAAQFNYQAPTLVTTHQDALQSRFTKTVGGRNQFYGNLAYQRTTIDGTNIFGFVDSTHTSGLDTTVNWSHRFSQFWSVRARYQFTGVTTTVTPYFANRTNVSAAAGITGNDQDPINWGPPRLIFANGIAGLSTAQASTNQSRTQAWGGESQWTRGRHNITVGGDIRRQKWDVVSQQDARGTFSFTGGATGSDLADFLVGAPHTSSIAFGNADKNLRAPGYDAYVTDDWRVSPVLTVNAGLRWEYEAPVAEELGRLVNLDLTPGFTSARATLATNPVGVVTGQNYPDSLLRPDWRGLQPRIGVAVRPVPGSSLVIRAGYGIYRNTAVYQPIAMLLAQQPPLSKTFSIETSAARPITLANGFNVAPDVSTNTFAVDPDFRVGYAHNWQVLVQRDLPASLTITATYLGTKGSHLPQEILPNTVPLGAVNPCPACPAGFVYLTSDGYSNKQTGQLQLRRRLRNGFTASVQYALSKATDAAGAFGSVSLAGSAIAQDWRHPEAEEGPSNFDQRHLVTGQVQYTTGVGVSGGGMLDGMRGKIFNGWTMTSQFSAGSGLPLTPIYLTSVGGTGVTGTIRPDVTGATGSAPDGSYANPSAYAAPAAGQWGNAGRNSITGPRQFSLDASIGRSFQWGDRLTFDWRINATNALNQVTYANVNASVGSPQFGLPTLANPMRKIQSSLRVRF